MIPYVDLRYMMIGATAAAKEAAAAAKAAYAALVSQLELNSKAFAQGNGFIGNEKVNGITHTYVSAEVYFELGPAAAEKLGNLKEMFSDDPRDEWRDQWNNEVGRRMAKWAQDNGYGPEVLDRLILDAMNDPSNPIITDLNDPRIGIHDFDGDGYSETYVHPEPTWTEPHAWDESPWGAPDDPLRPRDYTGLPDPLGEAGEWLKDRWRDFADGMEDAWRRAAREIGDFGNWAADLFRLPFGGRDPLVLDLNLTGVQLTALDGSGAHFDFDMDGFAERTGWVSPGDALLVRDINGNGVIDNGGELFGSATQDGFTALAAFDLNGDGKISSAEAIWSDLRLWKDSNQDGITQTGEIVTLASHAVASIDLDPAASRERRAGNSILFDGGFTLTNGLEGEAVAVAFMTDQMNTVFRLPEGFEYDPEVFSLPNLRGYGLVPDLWAAMSLDPTLKAMVKDLIADASAFTTLQDVVGEYFVMAGGGFGGAFYPHAYNMQAFDHMLARWADVDTGAEERVQAETIAEKFMNEQTVNAYGNPLFYMMFEKFSTELGVRFYTQVAQLNEHAVFFKLVESFRTAVPANGVSFSQAELEAILAPAQALFSSPPVLDPDLERFALLDFDFASDTIGGDIAGFIDAELQSYDFDPAEPWQGYSDWYLDRKPLLEIIDRDGLVLDERHRAYTQNRDLRIFELPNAVYNEVAGGPGDDTLHGDPLGTLVKIDLITGGAGNDILLGGQGDDTYVFSDGSGSDIVSDLIGKNEIAFQGDLISSLARYSFADANRQDLLISFAGRSETVTVVGYFGLNGAPTLERITFADGPQASGRPARDAVFASLATAGDDVITSFPLATTIIGLAGNDTLIGRGYGDVLVGGAGNDILSGGGGDDVYRWAPGDGHDIIRDYSDGWNGWGGFDTIEFGAGIAPWDVTISQAGGGWDLVLALATGETLTLDSDVKDSNYRIEQVVFADGTVWTHAQMMAVLFAGTPGEDNISGGNEPDTIRGGAGNDTIEGAGGDDIIWGGSGNDLLSGSGGNDLYRFGLGDGEDIVREYTNGHNGWGGIDMVQFGEGIDPTDIVVTAAENGTDLVLTIIVTGEKIILDSTVTFSNYRVEHVRFADGTIWTHADMMAVVLAGTSGKDSLYGGYEAETISGLAGDDMIEGRAGNDILTGGLGNDLLHGSGGDDTYRFARGDGDDIVHEYTNGYHGWGGNDSIEFAAGIVPTDIVVTQADVGTDLVLTISGTTDRITINNGLGVSNYRVEQVRFADGTVWSYADLVARSTGGTPGNDTLAGDGAANTISGGAGNDAIEGRYGDDLLVGGTGNDVLSGSGGNDTYVFTRGDGADIVREFSRTTNGSEGFDTIEFGEGILPSEIAVTQVDSGWDLVLTIAGTADSITLDNDVQDVRSRIEQVIFADGTVWTHSDLMAKVHAATAGADVFIGAWEDETLSGAAGNDTLDGRGGIDILTGGTGNDTLRGGASDDTYFYNLGDGDDLIHDYKEDDTAATDMIVFGPNIAPATLIFSRVAADYNDIRIGFVGQAGSILIENQHWADTGIESIKFADGTIWDHAKIMERYVLDQQTAGNDLINATHFAETILAGAGNDSVVALAGADTLVGGTGNDRLEGGTEADTYIYNLGDGDDVIHDYKENDTATTDMIVFGLNIIPATLIFSRVAGDWSDIRIGFVGHAGSIIIDNQHWADTGIESIKFADGTIWDHAKILERYLADQQTAGNDTINGSHVADIVVGGGGDDTISSGSGDDVLSGGTGNDRLEGSDGSDTYLYNEGDGHDVVQDYKGTRNNILQFGEGITQAELLVSRPQGDATSIRISFKTLPGSVTILNQTWSDAGVETIRFHDGTSLSEGALLQLIGIATNGSDTLAGTSGADMIWALEGADTVSGLAGADIVHGQDGNDVLIGGEGVDSLAGGAGADTFRFNPNDSGLGTAADRITDFLSGVECIDLAAIDADTNVAGNQAFAFIGSSEFAGAAGQLRFAYDGLDTWLEADTNGDGMADFQIVLSGNLLPMAADFVL